MHRNNLGQSYSFFNHAFTARGGLSYKHGRRQMGKNGISPQKLGLRNKKLYKSEVSYSLPIISVIFWYDTHTAQELGSLFWCQAVMNL